MKDLAFTVNITYAQLVNELPKIKHWVEENCHCEATKRYLLGFIEASLFYRSVLEDLNQTIYTYKSQEIQIIKRQF